MDLKAIQQLSRQKNGFGTQKRRVELWPRILGINRFHHINYKGYICRHRDAVQVKCDIDRSLWHFAHVSAWDDSFLRRRRIELSEIVLSILCRNRNLYYYQGFHDFISVFLMVFDDDHLAFLAAETVCNKFMADFMCVDFQVISKLMSLILELIGVADKTLHSHMIDCGIEPYFATSWLLTWLAHDLHSIDIVSRLFDVFLCSPPCYILYFCAAMVIEQRQRILACDCDFAAIHTLLIAIPKQKDNDDITEETLDSGDSRTNNGVSSSKGPEDEGVGVGCKEKAATPLSSDDKSKLSVTSRTPIGTPSRRPKGIHTSDKTSRPSSRKAAERSEERFDVEAVVRTADELMRREPPWKLLDLANPELQILIREGRIHMLQPYYRREVDEETEENLYDALLGALYLAPRECSSSTTDGTDTAVVMSVSSVPASASAIERLHRDTLGSLVFVNSWGEQDIDSPPTQRTQSSLQIVNAHVSRQLSQALSLPTPECRTIHTGSFGWNRSGYDLPNMLDVLQDELLKQQYSSAAIVSRSLKGLGTKYLQLVKSIWKAIDLTSISSYYLKSFAKRKSN